MRICGGNVWRRSVAALLALPPAAAYAGPEDSFQHANRQRDVECLAAAIAYEAGFESREGQQAVAEVVLNRVRHPAYPKSVCGVVFAGAERRSGCQFTFTCDGSLKRRLPAAVHAASRAVAEAALAGELPARVDGATHYHADYVSPYWAPRLALVGQIGAHRFYRAAGKLAPRLPARGREASAPDPTFAPWGLALAPPPAS